MYHFPYPTPGAIVSSAGEMRPGRLWSLLDMIEIYANSLFIIGEALSSIHLQLNMNPSQKQFSQMLSSQLVSLKTEISGFFVGRSLRTSGRNLRVESVLGFRCVVSRASLAHANRNFDCRLGI